MRVKYLAQEHNAVPRPGLEPGPPDPESSALTIRPPRLPQIQNIISCILLEFTKEGNLANYFNHGIEHQYSELHVTLLKTRSC